MVIHAVGALVAGKYAIKRFIAFLPGLFAPQTEKNVDDEALHHPTTPLGPIDPVEMAISDLPPNCFKEPHHKKMSGRIVFPESQRGMLATHLRIGTAGADPNNIKDIQLILGSVVGLNVDFMASDQSITIGQSCGGRWIFHLWGKTTVVIGDLVTANSTDVMINDGGEFVVGRDCMFANAFVHVGDNHAIFDIETENVLNLRENPRVVVEDHVWIAARATVIADTRVGRGSIIGSGTIAKGRLPAFSLVAGIPGEVRKTGISWTRSYTGQNMKAVIEKLKPPSKELTLSQNEKSEQR